METQYQQIIEKIPFLGMLPPETATELLTSLETLSLPPGVIFLKEGEPGDEFFIILSGVVEIIKALGSGHERHLATRSTGSVIGEMSLLNPEEPRSASARTKTAAEILVVTREQFETLLARYPAVSLDLLRRLSRRLRTADETIIDDLRRKNRELNRAYADLKAAQEQIIEQEVLERELQNAAQIQLRMLPQSLPQLDALDIGAVMVPARRVGGDFYDVIQIDDRRLALVIGDVAGKGIPAALYMALVCTLVRAEARRQSTAEEVLRAVNRELDEREMDGMFVTLLYGELDLETLDFTYVRAGHDHPFIWHDGEAVAPGASGKSVALGLIPTPMLDAHRLRLQPGSAILLSTDGVTEAIDAATVMFGRQRLQRMALTSGAETPQQLCSEIVEQVLSYQGDADQFDDITLLAVRIR